MDVLWQERPGRRLDVGTVHDRLDREFGHRCAYTTVMTTMTRLWEKGVLDRIWNQGAYAYMPRETQYQFEERQFAAIQRSIA